MLFNLSPSMFISRMIVLLTAFAIHEFAHAWTANYFGDDTAKVNGRLTLNPLAHLDPMGSLMLILVGFGWAKPVPVNPYALRRKSPSAMMWVAFAGPFSNLIMAIVAAMPLRYGLVSISFASQSFMPTLSQVLFDFVTINLILMLFNLIPLAPLDGDKIAAYFFPPSWSDQLNKIRPYGPMILMVLIFAAPYLGIDILGWILGKPITFLMQLLIG